MIQTKKIKKIKIKNSLKKWKKLKKNENTCKGL